MAKYTNIETVEQLFKLVGAGHTNFFVQLNFGFRSSKYITPGEEDGTLEVLNLIDDTTQTLTAEQIMDESYTNIGRAIKLGSFWMEDYEREVL